jgi:hypothetical protein
MCEYCKNKIHGYALRWGIRVLSRDEKGKVISIEFFEVDINGEAK